MLFISSALRANRQVNDRVAIMCHGRILDTLGQPVFSMAHSKEYRIELHSLMSRLDRIFASGVEHIFQTLNCGFFKTVTAQLTIDWRT